MQDKPTGYPTAYLAGGCFWCTESDFRQLKGVLYTEVGYTGGSEKKPDYALISTGKTNHAEANAITYDPAVISYAALLEHFLTKTHDPTQKNRQGPNIGPQYRSAIFYQSDAEKQIAQDIIAKITAARIWPDAIVTTLEPMTTFWLAEDYHQQYYRKYRDKYGVPHINVILKGRTE